jgi:hypothetical protein
MLHAARRVRQFVSAGQARPGAPAGWLTGLGFFCQMAAAVRDSRRIRRNAPLVSHVISAVLRHRAPVNHWSKIESGNGIG